QRRTGSVKWLAAPLVAFGLDEIAEELLVGPTRGTVGRPLIVVGTIATDVDHGVHRRPTAEDLAAREIATPPAECGFRLGRVVPVVIGLEKSRERDRRVYLRRLIPPTGLHHPPPT